MGVFDNIISQVAAEDRAILDKYPALRTSIENLETNFVEAARNNAEWQNWQAVNWDPQAGMTKEERRLRGEVAAANARLEAAEASAGTSSNDIVALRAEVDRKVAEVQRQSMASIEGMNHFYQAASKRLLPHQREFGTDLDPQQLLAFMQQNKIADPDAAYDKMVATARAELATKRETEREAKVAADIAAAEQRGREAAARELAMGPGGMMPTDGTGGIAGVTGRMDAAPKMSDDLKARVDTARLGDGSLAALGYEAYRRGEFNQTAQ